MSTTKPLKTDSAIYLIGERTGYSATVSMMLALTGNITRTKNVIGELDTKSVDGSADGCAVIAAHEQNYAELKAAKLKYPGITAAGIIEFRPNTSYQFALSAAYADLLESRMAIIGGILGDKGFVLTAERGVAVAANPRDLAVLFATLFLTRFQQDYNHSRVNRVDALPQEITADCAEMLSWTREWEKLALFPNYQRSDITDSQAIYPGAAFGFVAKRTALGTLVTARATGKQNPGIDDLSLITAVDDDGAVDVTTTKCKAGLNAPLAHRIFAERPEISYIVHSHLFLPGGREVRSSAPGTAHDWDVIKQAVTGGADIISQPHHGSLILLRHPRELLNILGTLSIYYAQPALYDQAYARFQKMGHFENVIGGLGLRSSMRVLDFCCGTGLSTEMLQKIGFRNIVLADGAEKMLHIASKRTGYPARLVHLDSTTSLPGKFALVAMRQAFNYVSPKKRAQVFNRVAAALEPGGAFVFNSFLPLTDGVYRSENTVTQGDTLIQTNEVNTVTGALVRHAQRTEIMDFTAGKWTAVHDINQFHQHEPEDVLRDLRTAGLTAMLSRQQRSLCYVARKPV